MSNRGRIHVGRVVYYYPTAAEEAAYGAGPWSARITSVNSDSTVNLAVDPPGLSVDAAPVDQANAAAQSAAYVQADVQSIAALANANKAAINALAAQLAGRLKASVSQNRYTLTGQSSAV